MDAGHTITLSQLESQRRRCQAVRRLSWCVLAAELVALLVLGRAILLQPRARLAYAGSLVAVLAWFHLLPLVLTRWGMPVAARVHSAGDGWRIGRYSEAELRQLYAESVARLPRFLRGLQICIVDVRSVAAWTWVEVLLPRPDRAKPIFLTSGSLHYLEPDELQAVLLHEGAHHLPENRTAVSWAFLLTDITVHAFAFWAAFQTSSINVGTILFVVLRAIVSKVSAEIAAGCERAIEHACDLFAARRVGCVPTINALLKLAEDDELSEVIVVWAARELVHDTRLTMDDLVLALADSRPYGRIFHENLIRHAGELTKILCKAPGQKANPPKRRKINRELQEFIEQRQARTAGRIRWRRLDSDGDGRLSGEELTTLRDQLMARPQDVLVTSHSEAHPTSHPPLRDRILFLLAACPPAS